MLSVPCPRCGLTTEADETKPMTRAFPFCSDRCRMSDLGKWFNEEYRVAGAPARHENEPHPEE